MSAATDYDRATTAPTSSAASSNDNGNKNTNDSSSSLYFNNAEADAASAAAAAGAAGLPRALAALRLTRLFAARMVATLDDPSRLRAQIYSRGAPNPNSNGNGKGGEDGSIGIGGGVSVAAAGGVAGFSRNRSNHGKLGGGGGIRHPAAGNGVTAITEGREEIAITEKSVAAGGTFVSGGSGGGDIVVEILASLVSLLCVAEEKGGGRVGGGWMVEGGLSSVAGFADLQLEGVGLLLVLLGTQAYGAPSLSPDTFVSATPPLSSNPTNLGTGGLSPIGGKIDNMHNR